MRETTSLTTKMLREVRASARTGRTRTRPAFLASIGRRGPDPASKVYGGKTEEGEPHLMRRRTLIGLFVYEAVPECSNFPPSAVVQPPGVWPSGFLGID